MLSAKSLLDPPMSQGSFGLTLWEHKLEREEMASDIERRNILESISGEYTPRYNFPFSDMTQTRLEVVAVPTAVADPVLVIFVLSFSLFCQTFLLS